MIAFLAKVMLAGIFLYAGFVKLLDYDGFIVSIKSFELIPSVFLPIIATAVPIMELLVAVGMFWRFTSGPSLLLFTVMCCGFTVLYGYAIAMGITPDCGCFGQNSVFNVTPILGAGRAVFLACVGGGLWYISLRARAKILALSALGDGAKA